MKYLDNSSVALREVSGGQPAYAVSAVGAFAAMKCSRNNPSFPPQLCCERSLRCNDARSVEAKQLWFNHLHCCGLVWNRATSKPHPYCTASGSVWYFHWTAVESSFSSSSMMPE